jgi:hypothetical protein
MIRTFIMVLCLTASSAFAQGTVVAKESRDRLIWEPPNPPRIVFVDVKPSVPREMIGSLRISEVSIVLEETQLDDMQARFGGEIGHRGDAGESLDWLCLAGRGEDGPWVLWLTSGEVDGPSVGSFQWRRVPADAKFDPRCKMLRDYDNAVALPLGLRLVTTEGALLQILGQPTLRKGNLLRYEHEHDLVLHDDPYTSWNTVIVTLRQGKVWGIAVNKTTQN